jgi:hypothetical protein
MEKCFFFQLQLNLTPVEYDFNFNNIQFALYQETFM